jgi:Protein of unknown function (DUF1549)/Protein of unknown function (DUF1553)
MSSVKQFRMCPEEPALLENVWRADVVAGRRRVVPKHLRWVFLLCLLASPALAGREAANDAPASGLEVEPARVNLIGQRAQQQLVVTLREADGSVRDVTRLCQFRIEPNAIAEMGADGLVSARADGRGALQVSLGVGRTDVELRVDRATWVRPAGLRTDVVPLFSKAGCNSGACHGNLNGKGGFRLSLRGEDPAFDLASLTHDASGRRMSLIAPQASLVLLKPSGILPHEGGRRFGSNSIEASLLFDWIKEGARDDKSVAPRVRSLRVFPAERILAPGFREQQLLVTAELADGTTRDVTRQAAFDLSDPTRAEVSSAGLVKVTRNCETAVSVRYMNGRGTARLAFLADAPEFVWRGPPANGPIDDRVFAKLKAMRLNPSGLCDDSVFLRRASLDAIGRLPEPAEARSFLHDRDPEKRSRLVDRLVDRPEFADFWALKWADVLRNEEKTMGEKGAWVFQRWLRDEIARDAPLGDLVRQIVAGLGSTWQNPPSSFYRTNRDPMTAAETVSQVFLGIRLQCARCHNHPFDVWTQDDYFSLAAFFSNISRKQVNNTRRDRLDLHEINGDEMIYLAGHAELVQPRSGALLQPKYPGGGPSESTSGEVDNALDRLATWLTKSNRQFSRNLANRVWFHLLGRGIVEPVDDFRDSNPPSNPALLESLAASFEAHGLRLKPLVAQIMKSQTYQLSATPLPGNADDESNFSHAAVKLLPAETLLDGISQVLGAAERFPRAPDSLRAAQLPGTVQASAFLKSFGKPDRLLTCECERSETTTLAQAFQMINGETVRKKLESPSNRISKRLEAGAADSELLAEIYLTAVCRKPTPQEQAAIKMHLSTARDRRAAWEDVVWALLNSKEFLLRH